MPYEQPFRAKPIYAQNLSVNETGLEAIRDRRTLFLLLMMFHWISSVASALMLIGNYNVMDVLYELSKREGLK